MWVAQRKTSQSPAGFSCLHEKPNKKWGKYAYFYRHFVPTRQENRKKMMADRLMLICENLRASKRPFCLFGHLNRTRNPQKRKFFAEGIIFKIFGHIYTAQIGVIVEFNSHHIKTFALIPIG